MTPTKGRNAAQTQIAPSSAPTCAIYLRISLDKTGQELGVDRQRQDCEEIARRKGWRIVAVFVDNDLGASKRKVVRPEYDKMLAAHGRAEFQHVIMWAIERLTRQPRQLEDWIEKAEKRAMCLVTKNGDLDLSTPQGVLVARLLMAVAAAEGDVRDERLRRSLRQRAERGVPNNGYRLSGYTAGGEVIEAEAQVVRDIFARFAAGDSLSGIARWLTEQGVPPRRPRLDNRWAMGSVKSILTNPRYCGRTIYDGQPTGHRGNWTPLVDEATFDDIQLVLTDPQRIARHARNTDRRHLGSSLFRCGVCQGPLGANAGIQYRCARNHCLTRKAPPVDTYVLATVAAYLASVDLADLIAPKGDSEAARAGDDIKAIRVRLAKAKASWMADLIDDSDYRDKKASLTAELANATAARARASHSGLSILLDDTKSPSQVFVDASLNVQRGVIDALATVTLAHTGRTGRYPPPFDETTVDITWKY